MYIFFYEKDILSSTVSLTLQELMRENHDDDQQ
jgi:hypothetical protein